MKYIIAASVGTDDVYQSDGTYMKAIPGGAGFYALCGLRLFSEDVVITGGVGPSYFQMHGDWYRKNRVTTEGLVARCEDAVTTVDYRAQDDRTDSPSIGLWEFRKRDPSIDEVSKYIDHETKGIYTFRHFDRDFLEALIEKKKEYGFKFMWEISEDACTEENRADIEKLLPEIDVFSINRHELCLLYGTDDENEAIDKFLSHPSRIAYVRRGKDGAVVLDGEKKTRFYSLPCRNREVVDTTGCGNSSSGAFLYGVSEGFSAQYASSMGAVAASYVLAQFGPPETFNEEITKQALDESDKLYKENIAE